MNIKEKRDICEHINDNLLYLGKSNVEVANILGVEPSIITNWRNFKADDPKIPGLEKACLLAQLFGETLDDFYNHRPNVNHKASSNYKYTDYLNDKANSGKVNLEILNIAALRSLISDFINNLSIYVEEEDKLFEVEDVFEKRYYELDDLFSLYVKAIPEEYRNRYFSRYIYSKEFTFDVYDLNADMLYEFVKNKAVIVHKKNPFRISDKKVINDYESTIKIYSKICQSIKMGIKTITIECEILLEKSVYPNMYKIIKKELR